MSSEPPINVVYRRGHHHAAHAGYDMVGRYLGPRRAKSVTARWPSWRGFGVITAVAGRLSGSEFYSWGAFIAELLTLGRMARSSNQIFHFLYAENQCRVVPYFEGWRGHRVVGTFHHPPGLLERGIKNKRYLRRFSAIIALSRHQQRYLQQFTTPHRVHFVPHGVDSSAYHPFPTPPTTGPPLIVAVGDVLRDYATLAGSLRLLIRDNVGFSCQVVTREPSAGILRDIAGVQVRARLSDAELVNLYRSATLVVLPLEDAVANNALLEALACGLPLVVSDVGGVRDYADDTCAVLVSAKDPAAMAGAIAKLLADPAERQRLRIAARARAEALDYARIADELRRVYGHLAEDCGSF